MTDNTQYTDINRGNNDVTPEGVLAEQSEVLLDDSQRATGWHEDANQEWEEREARNELKACRRSRRAAGRHRSRIPQGASGTVVLVGVWSSAVTTQAKAEESLRVGGARRNRRCGGMRWFAAASLQAGCSHVRWFRQSQGDCRHRGA